MPPEPRLPPAFRRLACSTLAAHCSEQVALAAAPLVAVLLLGGGAVETGYLQAAQTLPFLLLSLPAGVLADRCCRRREGAARPSVPLSKAGDEGGAGRLEHLGIVLPVIRWLVRAPPPRGRVDFR